MKIGIDARMVEHFGIGTYISNIITYLPKNSNNEYVLFGDKLKLKKYGLPIVETNFPIYSLQEQLFFINLIKKESVDLFFAPHYTIPVLYSGKIIVVIHDLIHLIYPNFLSSRFAHWYAKFMIKTALLKSKKVITISNNSKNDILKWFNVDSTKIKVIYPAVGTEFCFSKEKMEIKQKKYGKYLLYVGALRPHKNILNLVKVFNNLKTKNKIEHKLILVGKGKKFYVDEIKKIANKDCIIVDNATKEDIIEFYCGAKLFIFPSLYEGFGLPPLEAMSCSCPVAVSNTSSLPEVVGDAGIYFNPNNLDDMEQKIMLVLRDENLREQLVQKGLQRKKLFSWDKTVKGILEVFNEV